MIMEVRSYLETVSIQDTAGAKEAVLEANFSAGEMKRLRRGRVATICGNLAIKRAVKALLRDNGFASLPEKEIAVGRDEDGAPSVLFHARGISSEKVRVSLSHTRCTAYGIAVYEQERDG